MRRLDNFQRAIIFVTLSGPSAEPVTLTELKAQLRVDGTADDTYITALGVACRNMVEAYTARRLMPRTEKLLLDFFPSEREILIPAAPISAITAVKSYDQNDAATVFDATKYVTDVAGPIGQVTLKYGNIWPVLGSDRRPANAVAVEFSSGYADAASVPEPLKLAIKLLAGHFFENREATTMLTVDEIPLGIKHVLSPYRVWEAIL